jgi:hypothetical protein
LRPIRKPGEPGSIVATADPFRVVVCRHVPTVAGSLLEAQSDNLQASVFSVGTLVPLPALWHFNGAGIGFPQGSCRAELRYVAKALPSGELGKQGGNNPGADTNPPEDQEDPVERVEVV